MDLKSIGKSVYFHLMDIAIIQYPLTFLEFNQLSREFPDVLFLSFSRQQASFITDEHWEKTTVLFTDHLSEENLNKASHLRWIHSPLAALNRLPMKGIEERATVLVTNTREENIHQVGEYVIGAILAFAKNLFHYKDANKFPSLVWDCKWRNQMWTLKNRTLLQIGMGKEGEEIARRAAQFGMKVFGVDEVRSYHLYCQKEFTVKDLHSLLPHADVVSIAPMRNRCSLSSFGKEELQLMREDSILSLLGNWQILDVETLSEMAHEEKFRGILLDVNYQTPVPAQSPLWNIKELLLTPEVGPRPKTQDREAFRIFRFNLRQFLHGNFSDMKNLIDPSMTLKEELEDWV